MPYEELILCAGRDLEKRFLLLGNYFFIDYISYCGCVAVQPVRTLDMCKSVQTDEYMSSSSSLYRFGQKGKEKEPFPA